MVKINLKTGDSVKVISGGFRGLVDNISQIKPKEERVYLKKATRQKYDKSPGNKKKSELKEILVPIHVSNVKSWKEEKEKSKNALAPKARKAKK